MAGLGAQDAQDAAVKALGGREVRDGDADVVEHPAEATVAGMLGWTRYVPDARRRRRGGRGKIALAHMKEFPDYYERLKRMEAEAERDWAAKKP
jgi:Protein of unknown function (DUF5661)